MLRQFVCLPTPRPKAREKHVVNYIFEFYVLIVSFA
jgi:hypothetical protein